MRMKKVHFYKTLQSSGKMQKKILQFWIYANALLTVDSPIEAP